MNEHDNDLKPENIDGELNVYAVSYVSNNYPLRDTEDSGTEMRNTDTVAYFTTYNGAVEFCRKYPDYYNKDHSKWKWRISHHILNEDPLDQVNWCHGTWFLYPDGSSVISDDDDEGMPDHVRCEIDDLQDDIDSIKSDITKIKEALFKSCSVVIR